MITVSLLPFCQIVIIDILSNWTPLLIPTPATPVPVSYTHLDVYKRQLYNHAVLSTFPSMHLKALHTITPPPHDPVSYTHLDVYKRQV